MSRRRPYVGEGADGCLRSAEVDRSEADGMDRTLDSYALRLESAAAWEEQAIAEALEVEVLALHYLEAWVVAGPEPAHARCACGERVRVGGHRQHLADVIAAWFSGRGAR